MTIERLYVVQCCTPDHFYVGLSSREIFDLDGTAHGARLREHASGSGARFTTKHGYGSCGFHAVVPNAHASTREDDMTRYLMARYGWQNVRGGRYVRVRDDWETYWLPPAFRTGSFRDILKLRTGTVSKFPAELRGLVDRFCAVCGS